MGATQPFTYTGYQKDELAGTYFAQAREYNPALGRFMAEDIIRGTVLYPQSLNHYAYCYNNPEGFVDEDGELPLLTMGIGAAVGAAWEGVSTVVDAKVKGEEVDWKEVGINAAKGAVKGAVAGSGAGLLAEVVTDGLVDGVGDVAKQMIVEGKSWEEVDKGKAIRTGAASSITSLTLGELSENDFLKDKVLKGKSTKVFAEENEKALIKALHLEKKNKEAKKIFKSTIDIVEKAKRKLEWKTVKKEYLGALKDFSQTNFLNEWEGTLKDWGKSYTKSAGYCILKQGGMA